MASKNKRPGSPLVKPKASPPKPLPPYSPSDTLQLSFENKDWSDLTIELSDGSKMPVHKYILCSRNEYFNGMFGLKSSAAFQKRKNIKFADDDPDAVRAVIRKVYGWPTHERAAHWKYWFELITVADKFLQPELASFAEDRLYRHTKKAIANDQADEVCDVLCRLHEIDSRPQVPLMIKDLAKMSQHFASSSERFEAYLRDHADIMVYLIEYPGNEWLFYH